MSEMQNSSPKSDAVALSLEALYDLLQGKPTRIAKEDGAIHLCPDGAHLVIMKEGIRGNHRVWMAELALAWNMLAGFGTQPISA
jgi:hypothetical protein